MRKVDWNKFIFISKGEWFTKGTEVKCVETYCEIKINDTVMNTVGLFKGDSIVDGESDACPFYEFDIYYNGVIVNELSYLELFDIMKSVD